MVKGFEDLESAQVEDVDAMAEMERAKREIQEREERKAITQGAGGAPAAPRMTLNVGWASFFPRERILIMLTGKQNKWNRAVTAPALDFAQGGLRKPGSSRGENCHGKAKSQGGWEQIWYDHPFIFSSSLADTICFIRILNTNVHHTNECQKIILFQHQFNKI